MPGLLSEPVVSGMPYIGISPGTVYRMYTDRSTMTVLYTAAVTAESAVTVLSESEEEQG